MEPKEKKPKAGDKSRDAAKKQKAQGYTGKKKPYAKDLEEDELEERAQFEPGEDEDEEDED